jgi:MAF protein
MALPEIVLASTSGYRRELLSRLQIPFSQTAPCFEESQQPGESPERMALRLAEGKARSVEAIMAVDKPEGQTVIIGSDQVAHRGAAILSKPGNHTNAATQLTASSGQWVHFCTALFLLHSDKQTASAVETYSVKFRRLSENQISRYLSQEQPYDCAGSLKAESLGITLLEDARGRDITTLYGLPLMLLRELFLSIDVDITSEAED